MKQIALFLILTAIIASNSRNTLEMLGALIILVLAFYLIPSSPKKATPTKLPYLYSEEDKYYFPGGPEPEPVKSPEEIDWEWTLAQAGTSAVTPDHLTTEDPL